MFRLATCTLTMLCVLVRPGLTQTASPNTANATCTFQDGKQINVRYNPVSIAGKDKLPEGKVWTPKKVPMLIFTQVGFSIGASHVPIGAFRLYVIPRKDTWTLIVNKDERAGSPYDDQQDLLRTEMQTAEAEQGYKQFKVVFAQVAPKQCNMRMYYGKTGTWAEFKEN